MMLIGWPEKAFETMFSSQPPMARFAPLERLEANFFPLPKGSCHTMLVTLVKGWSYMDSAFSARRLRGSCGPMALPLAFSNEPEELSMAFDQVNEFKKNRPLETRR